jgi:hypothetical protein
MPPPPAVEQVAVSGGVVGDVEIVVALPARNRELGRRIDVADQALILVRSQELLHVIHVGSRRYDGGEEIDAAIRVLIGKDVVEPARMLRHVNAAGFLDLGRIGQAGHIQ